MPAPTFDPEHLDIASFASHGGELAGQWPLSELQRLHSATVKQVDITSAHCVTWQLSGQVRRSRGNDDEIWLTIRAETTVFLECQRCMQPLPVVLRLNNDIRFVRGEEAAAALDEDSEEDVLALSRSLDAKSLVEDELLLALPLVPKHEDCSHPLAPTADQTQLSEKANPFAILAKLKSPS